MKTEQRKRSPTDFDVAIGKRIRLRRTELNLSQTALGDKVGLAFQQIQKYEHGSNRIPAARLVEIAKALKAPLTFFLGEDIAKTKLQTSLFVDDALAVRLLKAFSKLQRRKVKEKIVLLTEQLAEPKR